MVWVVPLVALRRKLAFLHLMGVYYLWRTRARRPTCLIPLMLLSNLSKGSRKLTVDKRHWVRCLWDSWHLDIDVMAAGLLAFMVVGRSWQCLRTCPKKWTTFTTMSEVHCGGVQVHQTLKKGRGSMWPHGVYRSFKGREKGDCSKGSTIQCP